MFPKKENIIIVTISPVIHLVSVINHENWPKAIMKRDRYEYRKIYLDLIRYLLR